MITIPEPCQEDFSKMTPTEKGVFCTKCNTDTYDFRSLSKSSILDIIAKNSGKKICGQFNNSQLMELNQGYEEWRNQTPKSFRSKFVFALLIGFGLTLFSCNEKNLVQDDLNEIAKIIETTPRINFINQETDLSELDLREYLSEEGETTEIEAISCETNDYTLGGDIAYTEEIFQPNENYRTAGLPFITSDFETYAVEVSDTLNKSAETTLPTPLETSINFTSKAFPNPTQGITTLELEIKKTGQYTIELFNNIGQLINTIYTGNLSEGRQSFEVNLFDQNTGMYLIQIRALDQNETLKIQRVN